jgi:hypothetical protein
MQPQTEQTKAGRRRRRSRRRTEGGRGRAGEEHASDPQVPAADERAASRRSSTWTTGHGQRSSRRASRSQAAAATGQHGALGERARHIAVVVVDVSRPLLPPDARPWRRPPPGAGSESNRRGRRGDACVRQPSSTRNTAHRRRCVGRSRNTRGRRRRCSPRRGCGAEGAVDEEERRRSASCALSKQPVCQRRRRARMRVGATKRRKSDR